MLLLTKKIWLTLGILALLTRAILPVSYIEENYSRGFFLRIREWMDSIVPEIPFPPFYFFFLFAFAGIIFSFRHFRGLYSFRRKLLYSLLSFANLIGFIVFSFMLLWGFNYKRIAVEEQLELNTDPIELENLKSHIEDQTHIIAEMRKSLFRVSDYSPQSPVTSEHSPLWLEDLMRESLEGVLEKYDYPTNGRVNIRELKPEGILFRFNSSGIYLPFVGEGHIDAALHPLQKPFVMAHEMAHGYGFGDEGTCNFWAYLACIHSNDLFVRYVGHLTYWRYLASEWKRNEPEEYQKFRDELPEGIVLDLNTINENLKKYPSFFPQTRDFIYELFLRSQGVDDGMDNYNKIVPMVKSYWDKLKVENS